MHTSQLIHCEHPETQGKHLSCCSSQKVPEGQDGVFPLLSGLVGSVVVSFFVSITLSTHFKVLASQFCEDVQDKHIFPL